MLPNPFVGVGGYEYIEATHLYDMSFAREGNMAGGGVIVVVGRRNRAGKKIDDQDRNIPACPP
jgi:hypothetical protein